MAQNLNLFFSGNSSERICITLDDSMLNLSSIITLMTLCYGIYLLIMSLCQSKSLFEILFLEKVGTLISETKKSNKRRIRRATLIDSSVFG